MLAWWSGCVGAVHQRLLLWVQHAEMTKAVCYRGPLHYCLMILSAIIQRWFTAPVCLTCVMTSLHLPLNRLLTLCVCVCAYVSQKKEDTRTKSALLFSELRSPAVSFSSWREQLDTDGTVGIQDSAFIQSDLPVKEAIKFYFEDKLLLSFTLAIPVSVGDLWPE